MKRVIQFSKLRFVMLIVSLLLICGGIAGVFYRGGFNLGIDFQAGLNMRVQIAPEIFSLTYTGDGRAELNVSRRALELTIDAEEQERYFYPFEVYSSVGILTATLDRIEGISVVLPETVSPALSTERIVGFSHPVELDGETPVSVNTTPASGEDVYADIDAVRSALMSIDIAQIQTVGDEYNQEYIIRVQDPGEDDEFAANMTAKIEDLLGSKFGANQIITKQSDYVGPRFSRNLGSQSIYLTAIALALILVYIWIRFKLPYAVSAIIALTHDVIIMLGFIGTFQMEVSTATMAAVLTIIGYSLNDTIVIFDRVRENEGLIKESDFKTIVNTSITQSISRTLITSLTTLLAVAAIYIFGTGSIKEFALNLIVGIVVGTYSSIFVANPVLMGWMNLRKKRKKRKELQKYGGASVAPEVKKEPEPAAGKLPDATEVKKEAEKEAPAAPKQLDRQQRGKKRTTKKKKK